MLYDGIMGKIGADFTRNARILSKEPRKLKQCESERGSQEQEGPEQEQEVSQETPTDVA